MRDQLAAHDFVYVHTDIPAGITIRAWRAKRAAECAARRQQERAGRVGAPLVAPGLVARRMAAKICKLAGVVALTVAIRDRRYARSAGPQTNVTIRTCVRSHDD
jgi:hypothetical protein